MIESIILAPPIRPGGTTFQKPRRIERNEQGTLI